MHSECESSAFSVSKSSGITDTCSLSSKRPKDIELIQKGVKKFRSESESSISLHTKTLEIQIIINLNILAMMSLSLTNPFLLSLLIE